MWLSEELIGYTTKWWPNANESKSMRSRLPSVVGQAPLLTLSPSEQARPGATIATAIFS